MALDIGIQLYSVRDSMEQDFEGTVKKVRELGYTSVEFAGFYGRTPEQINDLLAESNLKISGTHSGFDELVNNFDETVSFHKAIGNKNYIIPWCDLSSQEKIDAFVEKVKPISEKLAAHGINLGYHNHAMEFKVNADGSVPFEQLLYRTDIKFELDTYWAFVGMGDALAVMDRLGDRLAFIHLKDGDATGKGKPLGMGDAPIKAVFEKAAELGIPMVVESETCTPSGLDEARVCMEFLTQIS